MTELCFFFFFLAWGTAGLRSLQKITILYKNNKQISKMAPNMVPKSIKIEEMVQLAPLGSKKLVALCSPVGFGRFMGSVWELFFCTFLEKYVFCRF